MNDRIKKIRLEVGLTQDQFAKRIGLSRNYIAMIEIGQREPSDRTIGDICREFNVSEHWLREGVGDVFRERTDKAENIARFAAIMEDSDESFRRRFISALMDLPAEMWPEIEKFVKKISQGE